MVTVYPWDCSRLIVSCAVSAEANPAGAAMAAHTPAIAAAHANFVRMIAPSCRVLVNHPLLASTSVRDGFPGTSPVASLAPGNIPVASLAPGRLSAAIQGHGDGPARHDPDVVVVAIALAVPAPVDADGAVLGLRIAHAGDHALVDRAAADAVDVHLITLGFEEADGLLGALFGAGDSGGRDEHRAHGCDRSDESGESGESPCWTHAAPPVCLGLLHPVHRRRYPIRCNGLRRIGTALADSPISPSPRTTIAPNDSKTRSRGESTCAARCRTSR